jgi:hypothetical protein
VHFAHESSATHFDAAQSRSEPKTRKNAHFDKNFGLTNILKSIFGIKRSVYESMFYKQL